MPGNWKGMLPKIIPTKIPKKMAPTLGWSRRFTELPKMRSTRVTLSSGPATIKRSPIWIRKERSAKRFMPWRVIRVTFTPYIELKCISPNVLPFTSGWVTRMRFDTIGAFSACQSTSISRPINAIAASASSIAHTAFISSPTCSWVSLVGEIMSSPCLKCVHTNVRPKNCVSCEKVLPSRALFSTRSERWWGLACGLSSWVSRICSSSFSSLMRQM